VPTPAPTLAPTPEPTPTPVATSATYDGVMSSDAFVSTMGVDVSLTSTSEEQAIASRFAGLGVRQTRLPIVTDASSQALAANFFSVNPSVHAFGLTTCASPLGQSGAAATTPADVSSFQSSIDGHLNFVEAVNEPDNDGDSNWVSDTRSCIAPFAGEVDGLELVAPALITQLYGSSQVALGNIGSIASYGNIHRYFDGRNPDAPGWGASDACGTYGALNWAMCWARATIPGAPLVVTETGWNSNTEVDAATQAKYVERLYFVNAQAGIAMTSIYTMLGYTNGDGFGGDGLLNPDYSEKPAYKAIANIAVLLADPGPSFYPKALSYSLAPAAVGAGDGLRAMVLGKRNGSYDLALWQEVQSADPNSYGVDTPPPALAVTLSLPAQWKATTYAWQDDGSAPASSTIQGSTFNISVTDRMTIVQLSPSSGTSSERRRAASR
jgi:hypothetical protein